MVDNCPNWLLLAASGVFANVKLYWETKPVSCLLYKGTDVISFDLTKENWKILKHSCYEKEKTLSCVRGY
ncbi:hypothetical protein H5410_035819 [Solanum commersonii]|uniref:Uncharacterized protein n=1 Tax=Solanum commersonii TaxID=4109 RepID=A0A9J5Y1S8_SOLCO|nr:hypothetical protein H5410_035819 [Solanum commersonii]